MLNLENLRELREKKGLTQMEISKMCGVTLNAYVRWEHGCTKPAPENQAKLEEILK